MRELRFSLEVYDSHAIEQAVEAFSLVANVQMTMDERVATVRVDSQKGDLDQLCGELENFVLGATVDAASEGDS